MQNVKYSCLNNINFVDKVINKSKWKNMKGRFHNFVKRNEQIKFF